MGAVTDKVERSASRDDVHELAIMLAHACDDIPVQDSMKLQNLMFMLSNTYEKDDEMGFRPGTDGPYSDIVEKEVRHLGDRGILSIENGETQLTGAGRAIAERLAEKKPDVFGRIGRYKEMFNDMDADEILTYVCRSHPSKVPRALVDRLEPDVEKHVLSMLRKEKISSGKAAELLGERVKYVIDLAYKNGIYVLGY